MRSKSARQVPAPRTGATQKNQSCAIAQPPTNSAGPVERAGFTDVFVIGMLIRWISVSARPIAIGAKPFGARWSVDPRITTRKNAVSTTSATKQANGE